ncbi:MAG: hypothetical protein JSU74_05240 [Candidatus Zixiibacteriota bacterium]|nr:MAG: hypothetical protein JSU74_05240 [candidate division Zixibacteria bacterium]
MDTRHREFALLTVLLCVTRLSDLFATFLVTPNLARETNPLVSVLGQGWAWLIGVQVVLVSIIVLLNYYSLFKSKTEYPSEEGLSFQRFATRYYLGREQHWVNLIFRLPYRWNVFVKVFGYTLPRVLIVVGLLVSVSSLLLSVSPTYANYYLPLPAFYAVFFAIALLIYYRFFQTEYVAYRRRSEGL